MNYLSREHVLEQNMAHPDFPDVGLGDIAYVRKSFYRNKFVFTLVAADGEILLQNQDKIAIQNFVIEHSLELIPIH